MAQASEARTALLARLRLRAFSFSEYPVVVADPDFGRRIQSYGR